MSIRTRSDTACQQRPHVDVPCRAFPPDPARQPQFAGAPDRPPADYHSRCSSRYPGGPHAREVENERTSPSLAPAKPPKLIKHLLTGNRLPTRLPLRQELVQLPGFKITSPFLLLQIAHRCRDHVL